MSATGEYGGRVLRTLETGGRKLPPGAIVTPEMAMAWPAHARAVLGKDRQGFIEWFNQPIPGAPAVAQEAAAPGRRK